MPIFTGTERVLLKNIKSMSQELIILGAGASVDFVSKHCTKDIYYKVTTQESVKEPFPMTKEFLKKCIDKEVLKKDYYPNLWEFIQSHFAVSFQELKDGRPLDVEEVYIALENKTEELDKKSSEWIKVYQTKEFLIDCIENLLVKLTFKHRISIYHKRLALHCVENGIPLISFNWDTLMDDALFSTSKWNFETGYGIDFYRMYCDGKQIADKPKSSNCILLKPHGSINWFRYQDFYSDKWDGFTGATVSHDERQQTGLFWFSLKRRNNSEWMKLRLDLGRGYAPLLKMPVSTDIIPPGETREVKRSAYNKIYHEMANLVRKAEVITIIGFGMKDTDAYSKYLFQQARLQNSKKIIVNVINPCKGNTVQEDKMKEVCFSVFSPCEVRFPYKTFKEYAEALPN